MVLKLGVLSLLLLLELLSPREQLLLPMRDLA